MSKEDLPIEFNEGEAQALELKKKMAHEMKVVRQRFNQRVMRVKVRLLTQLGDRAERCGIKKLGHGRIVVAGENADTAIEELRAYILELQGNPETNPAVIAELRGLELRFNRQLIEVGKAHLEATREASSKNADMRIAFPAGQNLMVAVGNKEPEKEKALTNGPANH